MTNLTISFILSIEKNIKFGQEFESGFANMPMAVIIYANVLTFCAYKRPLKQLTRRGECSVVKWTPLISHYFHTEQGNNFFPRNHPRGNLRWSYSGLRTSAKSGPRFEIVALKQVENSLSEMHVYWFTYRCETSKKEVARCIAFIQMYYISIS